MAVWKLLWEPLTDSASPMRAAAGLIAAVGVLAAWGTIARLPPLIFSDQTEALEETVKLRAAVQNGASGTATRSENVCTSFPIRVCTKVKRSLSYRVSERIEVRYPRRVLTGRQFKVEVHYFRKVDPSTPETEAAVDKLARGRRQRVNLSGAGLTVKPAEEQRLPMGDGNPKPMTFTVAPSGISDEVELTLQLQKLSITKNPLIVVTDSDGRTSTYNDASELPLPVEIRTYAPIPESGARWLSGLGVVIVPLGLWEFLRWLLRTAVEKWEERRRKREEEERPRIVRP
jgi:hypothetical protein